MSKVICEVCGTVYPDNATVCPICGYPRKDSEKAARDGENQGVSRDSQKKGGHFSSKNVKKRQKAEGGSEPVRTRKSAPQPQKPDKPGKPQPSGRRPKAGAGLKAAFAIVLAGVIGFGCYIGYRFYRGAWYYDNPPTVPVTENSQQTQTPTEPSQTVPTESGIPCVGLSVSDESVTLDQQGSAWLLSVLPIPEDTTDSLEFVSGDETVATVNDQGRITAVGPGTTVITVTCGDSIRACTVVCDFEVETEPPTETGETQNPEETQETTEPEETSPTYSDSNWTLSNAYGDATLIIGEEFTLTLTNDAGEVAEVEWESDNFGVVTIDGNVIRGNYPGITNVSATIDGKTYTCIVRVRRNRE